MGLESDTTEQSEVVADLMRQMRGRGADSWKLYGIPAWWLWLLLGCALLSGVAFPPGVSAKSAEGLTVRVGEVFPDLEFPGLLSPDDYGKLGLGRSDGPLRISEIPFPYLIIEFFNKSCRPCQRQVREMEALYRSLLEGNGANDLRVLAVAVGNKAKYLPKYREMRDLTYPIAVDPNFDQWRRMGEPGRTPFLVFLRRKADQWMLSQFLFSVHSKQELEESIGRLRSGVLSREQGGEIVADSGRHLEMPLDSAALEKLATRMFVRLAGTNVNVEKVPIGNGEYVFRSCLPAGGRQLFARAASRAPVCETCHAVHFMYVFDDSAMILAFEPIHVTKYGNVMWSVADAAYFEGRLIGRKIESLEFDPEVDAVTRATMSSALIFDEIRRTLAILDGIPQP